jgi:hypothetical protein
VCLEERAKFKNIDFRTEADFACYYSSSKIENLDQIPILDDMFMDDMFEADMFEADMFAADMFCG